MLNERENPPLEAYDNFVIGPKYVTAPERKAVDRVPAELAIVSMAYRLCHATSATPLIDHEVLDGPVVMLFGHIDLIH